MIYKGWCEYHFTLFPAKIDFLLIHRSRTFPFRFPCERHPFIFHGVFLSKTLAIDKWIFSILNLKALYNYSAAAI